MLMLLAPDHLMLTWILEAVAVYGYIGRRHLVRRFGLTAHQAGETLAAAARERPDVLRYNPRRRCYEGQPRPLPPSDE